MAELEGLDSLQKEITHVVVLDDFDGLIIDNCESRALKYDRSNMRMCIGTATFVRVKQERQLVEVVKGRRKNREERNTRPDNDRKIQKALERRQAAQIMTIFIALLKR